MKSTKRKRPDPAVVRRNQGNEGRCLATIVRRKYLTDLRSEVADELSVRISYDGQYSFFPLAESQRDVAEEKAEAIRAAVEESGWKATDRFTREFTMAVFWLPNPLTCTYATFFTAVRPLPRSPQRPPQKVRVAILEPHEPVRRGLVHWLNTCPGYQCIGACDTAASFFKTLAEARPDLSLFNDPPCSPADEGLTERFSSEFPDLIGFPYGIYADSDASWLAVTGVDGGYYYRRRRPNQLLDPVSGLWQAGKPSRDSVESQIRNHVQTLFGFRAAPEVAFPELTRRERDVLAGLQRGYGDKAIATMLSISSWTVHTHLKSLFEKLGVHSRTEAVMKYFQK